MRAFCIAIAGLLIASSPAPRAQTEPDGTEAADVARAYLEAVRARGFSAQAEFLHPEELARFQRLLIPVFEREAAKGGRSLLNATFGRDATLIDVRLAAPDDFMRRFARVMAVRMPDQPVGFDELVVLGTVAEGENVHVLVRLSTGIAQEPEQRLEVVSLAPYQGAWKLMLNPDLEKNARTMREGADAERPAPRLVPRPSPPEPAETTGSSPGEAPGR